MRLSLSSAIVVGLGASVLVGGACSFTTGSGFEECASDLDCAASNVCSHRYCLPLQPGCQRAEGAFDAGDRIALAALMPLTSDGGSNERERYRLNAMRLAVSEANKYGGLKNRPYSFYVCDTSLGEVGAQTDWLVKNLEVPGIIVSGSDRLLAAEQVDSRLAAGTFMISPNATAVGLVTEFREHGNVWRVAPPDTLQSRVIARLVASAVAVTSDAGIASTVAIVADDSYYGQDFKLDLDSDLRRAGFTNVLQLALDHKATVDTYILTTVNALDNAKPAATVIIAFPDDVRRLVGVAASRSRLRAENGHRWFLTDSAKDPAIVDSSSRTELESATGTAPAQGTGPAYLSFSAAFSQQYQVNPDSYSYVAHSSDAMWLTLAATAWAAKTSPTITGPLMKDAMAQIIGTGASIPLVGTKWNDVALPLLAGRTINVDGASSDLMFDLDAGAPSSSYEVWSVVDGGISTLRYVLP